MKKYFCDICGERMQDGASDMTVQGADGIRLTVEAHLVGMKRFWKNEGAHVCRRCIARAFWPERFSGIKGMVEDAMEGNDRQRMGNG